MSDVYLSIGGNLGNRLQNLGTCQRYLEKTLSGIDKFSPVYESEAWGFTHPADFYNQILKCYTEMSPQALLQACLEIENDMGRQRNPDKKGNYQGRIIDIDIIFYDDRIIRERSLQIPHPSLYDRLFVLLPMADIAPDFVDPASKKNIRELISECTDQSKIAKTTHPAKLTDYE
ncbi:MAG: 2-amino-4-hydroxy-6-hydroxymethyldihydropteridine diphosphokinase [Bacteroidales bacterium]